MTSKPRHGPMGWRHPAMALAFGRAAKRAGIPRGDLDLVRAGKNLEQEAIAVLTVRPPSQQISSTASLAPKATTPGSLFPTLG
jgi:hypothetical protein